MQQSLIKPLIKISYLNHVLKSHKIVLNIKNGKWDNDKIRASFHQDTSFRF